MEVPNSGRSPELRFMSGTGEVLDDAALDNGLPSISMLLPCSMRRYLRNVAQYTHAAEDGLISMLRPQSHISTCVLR